MALCGCKHTVDACRASSLGATFYPLFWIQGHFHMRLGSGTGLTANAVAC